MHSKGNDFIIEGLSYEDDSRIRTTKELTDRVNEYGFLPLFKNHIPGFSVEEMTATDCWFRGDEEDPWFWRQQLAKEGTVAYGKFFLKKAGFISKEWFPIFANYRRDGYDFDSRYEDGLVNQMDHMIYETLMENKALASFELKARTCGKVRKGTGFDTSLTRLQMQTYLTVCDFKRKLTKKGEEYGWAAAVYTTPEYLFGRDYIRCEYCNDPLQSKEKIITHIKTLHPQISTRDAELLLK